MTQQMAMPQGQVLCASEEPTQFDSACTAYPVVLPPEKPDDKWKMFYYGHDGAWVGGTKPFLPTGWNGYAESDDGIQWTKVAGSLEKGSILAPSNDPNDFDSLQTGIGDIVRVSDDCWYMFYFGSKLEEGTMAGIHMRIGRAKSTDQGQTWEKLGMVLDYDPSEGLFCSWPRAIVPDDGSKPWQMIYHSFDGQKWRVYGATSTNEGASWERRGLLMKGAEDDDEAWDCSGIGTRSITPWRDGLLMMYEAVDKTGTHRIGAAYCDDSNAEGPWKPTEDGPLLEPGQSPLADDWTNLVVGTPYVLSMPDGSLRMYYVSRGKSEEHAKHAIGLVISDSGDISPSSWRSI